MTEVQSWADIFLTVGIFTLLLYALIKFIKSKTKVKDKQEKGNSIGAEIELIDD